MITRIAVVPYPPLLVPELTVRTTPETEPLRSACLRAVSSLTDAAREWVAVAADRYGPSVFSPPTAGTFRPYGVDVPITLAAGQAADPSPLLPLPVLMAGWLRGQAGAEAVTVTVVDPALDTQRCADLGAELNEGEASGLLVLADGTGCRDERSPFPPDERAKGFDELISAALARADQRALTDLDSGVANQLGVEGRAALQAIPGVMAASGGRWSGDVLYSEAPFGIGYHVAVCTRHDS